MGNPLSYPPSATKSTLLTLSLIPRLAALPGMLQLGALFASNSDFSGEIRI